MSPVNMFREGRAQKPGFRVGNWRGIEWRHLQYGLQGEAPSTLASGDAKGVDTVGTEFPGKNSCRRYPGRHQSTLRGEMKAQGKCK
ncbi:hypothetical protein Y1Q_0004999 [Alligator mississippiensis]|uniref:Uncharacterized protein n=1 Tax=Alligator mississippiensis TaxID=8496 RepID=A0A151PJA2_ALLMI|nr:hypothetical protein Y1Q_0004999 [Alligator mississippiensis]